MDFKSTGLKAFMDVGVCFAFCSDVFDRTPDRLDWLSHSGIADAASCEFPFSMFLDEEKTVYAFFFCEGHEGNPREVESRQFALLNTVQQAVKDIEDFDMVCIQPGHVSIFRTFEGRTEFKRLDYDKSGNYTGTAEAAPDALREMLALLNGETITPKTFLGRAVDGALAIKWGKEAGK